MPREVNQKIADYYSSKPLSGFMGGKTVRESLDSQSYEEQQAFGLKILQMVLEGKPLP
ncbi:hypothetical protein [Thermogutta sp.]|uniref:hypothetical protein n=1 Tax=Thermogutta sp. TaxID=1962930 RepID=UPI003C7A5E12